MIHCITFQLSKVYTCISPQISSRLSIYSESDESEVEETGQVETGSQKENISTKKSSKVSKDSKVNPEYRKEVFGEQRIAAMKKVDS